MVKGLQLNDSFFNLFELFEYCFSMSLCEKKKYLFFKLKKGTLDKFLDQLQLTKEFIAKKYNSKKYTYIWMRELPKNSDFQDKISLVGFEFFHYYNVVHNYLNQDYDTSLEDFHFLTHIVDFTKIKEDNTPIHDTLIIGKWREYYLSGRQELFDFLSRRNIVYQDTDSISIENGNNIEEYAITEIRRILNRDENLD